MIVRDDGQMMLDKIEEAKQKPGFSLPAYFFNSAVVYQSDLDKIIYKSWLYACHVSEIPEKGDFVTVKIDNSSVIITREKEGGINALMNSFRHRGSVVCTEEKGNAKSFICPYHAWVYNTQGKLVGAREMPKDFDKSKYDLKKAKLHIIEGMVYINCDPDAADFTECEEIIKPFLKPYDLPNAKVAKQISYVMDTDWKLVMENYFECYHCAPSHQVFSKSHSLQERDDRTTPLNDEMRKRTVEELGMTKEFVQSVYKYHDDSPAKGCDVYHCRYSLYDYKTGSEDGEPLAPLMGDFKGYDCGAGDMQLGTLTYMLNYADHCILFRFLPLAHGKSECKLVWFVKGDAVEGKDYDVDRLIYIWDHTTKEDKEIIMKNSNGVNSKFYEPGPYNPDFEDLNISFVNWYLKTLEE